MPTRITQNMLNSQLLRNLNNNQLRMDRSQNQLSTGRRINRPSDDPVGLTFAMRYRSDLSANDQYAENVDSAKSWLDFTDTMLDQSGNVFQRLRELTVQAANGTNSQEALNTIKAEVLQLREHMVSIGNSQFNGKNVFNGQKTDLQPYTAATADQDITDNNSIQFEIGIGVRMVVNVTGNQVFGAPADTDNTFKLLDNLAASLGNGDFAGIQTALGQIDSRMDNFLEIRADIGAKTNRIALSSERLKDINLNLSELQSKTEDADMAEVITNLKTDQNVYQASLSTGAKLISATLMDFLH